MDLFQKLNILSDAAKYDVACTSSGSSRGSKPGGIGNTVASGICHSFSNDGRCISLLKILMTNYCVYDCTYCVNRSSNDVPRAAFTPEEIINLTMNFYRRNYIEGLFLSSAIIKDSNHTMEMIIKVVKTLRNEYNFNGYIHIKGIPGADKKLITEAGNYVDRMSINIELPTNDGLKLLAPQKKKDSILGSMSLINSKIIENKDESKFFRNVPKFVPAGQSTQLIVGATPDNDLKILNLTEALYKQYSLKRVFYSAYVPVSSHPNLPAIMKPPLLREHRLYQADWLLRFYGFSANELLNEKQPDFDMQLDPKCCWAIRNPQCFPIEVNKADFETLLRVPGIGMRSARRIVASRIACSLNFLDLKKLGVVLKRARYFITCKGKYIDNIQMSETNIRENLLAVENKSSSSGTEYQQLSLFPLITAGITNEIALASLTGEL